ncbi:hypothetical protein KBD81_01245 [Candidatus Woesebacteria bacterium]|nr:hypothetical protein [Candidatus Woesebacteria bacterium]
MKDKSYLNLIKDYQRKFPSLISIGIFLEITPSLTEDSGLTYTAPLDRWYEAQTAYSIGYSDNENKILMDKLFAQFYAVFGYYPQLTTAWIIDTDTLDYISKNYGVKVHQLTREQWGTDSYTLYGGPPHYPYPAAENWIFMPDYQRSDAPLIVRQTVTDPLYNYGDQTNSFTSQPNDYSIDGKDIEYFKDLINQALFQQSQQGFVLIGLENSMNEQFQKEYVRQLMYIYDLKKENRIQIPTIDELEETWKKQKTSVYSGIDLVAQSDNQAYWITTENYRVRLRIANGKIYMSDIRVYDKLITDPYTTYEAQKEGFWVIPYILDSSLSVVGNEQIYSYSRAQDLKSHVSYIEISSIQNKSSPVVQIQDDLVTFTFHDKDNTKRIITFNAQEIDYSGFQIDDFKIDLPNEGYPVKYSQKKDSFQLNWEYNNKLFLGMGTICIDSSCITSFINGSQDIEDLRKAQYIFLFPEPINHPIDPEKTIIKLSNRYAVAGRNPVRFIITPLDVYGNLTTLPIESISYTSDQVNNLRDEKNTYNNLYFIDFFSETPLSNRINIRVEENELFEGNIVFAPNCKQSPKQCITNPQYSWWYLNSFIGDKTRAVIKFMNDAKNKNE